MESCDNNALLPNSLQEIPSILLIYINENGQIYLQGTEMFLNIDVEGKHIWQ